MTTKLVVGFCVAWGLAAGSLAAQTTQAEILAEIRALRERLSKLEQQVSALAPAPAAPAEAAKPPEPPPPPVFSAGPIDFSGLVDGYYSLNFNHASTRTNQLRNFDIGANQFSLNMAKLVLAHDADPVGFRVDLGFGQAFDIVHGADPEGLNTFRHIEQAYVSVKRGKGIFDFGKFVTAHRAEVIETPSNWNYSRSLLFAWAIPYYHFGARYIYPISKTVTGQLHLVNGWNNVRDNNSGKSFGVSGIWTPNWHFTWANNYMVGPENTGHQHRRPSYVRYQRHGNGQRQDRLHGQLRLRVQWFRPDTAEGHVDRRGRLCEDLPHELVCLRPARRVV